MNTITNLLATVIIAGWISTLALFSVQNYSKISLKLLTLKSIEYPVGVLLAICLSIGFLIGALLPLFFNGSKKSSRRRFANNEADEFDF